MMLRQLCAHARRALATAAAGGAPPRAAGGPAPAAAGAAAAATSAAPAVTPGAPGTIDPHALGAAKLVAGDVQAFHTQKRPVYALPLYGAGLEAVGALSDAEVAAALRAFGGLMRRRDAPELLRARLERATRADLRPKQLTIAGVVVSARMHKSVVVAARRPAYAPKLRLKHFRTRRFMAHDELNLCREGDRVVIRSCRPLSKRKAHVVVQNFGDPTRVGQDTRAVCLDDLVREDQARKEEEEAAAAEAPAEGEKEAKE